MDILEVEKNNHRPIGLRYDLFQVRMPVRWATTANTFASPAVLPITARVPLALS